MDIPLEPIFNENVETSGQFGSQVILSQQSQNQNPNAECFGWDGPNLSSSSTPEKLENGVYCVDFSYYCVLLCLDSEMRLVMPKSVRHFKILCRKV